MQDLNILPAPLWSLASDFNFFQHSKNMYVGLINECLPMGERKRIHYAGMHHKVVGLCSNGLSCIFLFFFLTPFKKRTPNTFAEIKIQKCPVSGKWLNRVPLSLLRRFSHRRLKKCHKFRKGERLKFLETGQNSPLTNNIKTYKIHKHGKTFVNHYLQNMKNAQSRE